MQAELEPVWRQIDSIKTAQSDHEARIRLSESKLSDFRADHDSLCRELRETKKELSEKLDLLIQNYHRTQGARSIAGWMPTIISTLVSLIAIYTFVKG